MLAENADGGRLLIMVEHQSAPVQRMAARMTTQTGLLYESLAPALRGADRRFPALLVVVVYAGTRNWTEPPDLSATLDASKVPMAVHGDRYLRLDLASIASEHRAPRNRFWVWAGLTFAAEPIEASELLQRTRDQLDLADEEERRLFEDYVAWFYAVMPRHRPAAWNPDERRTVEELMGRLTTLEENDRRQLREIREQGIRQGIEQGIEQGMARQRAMLVRHAVRRFGPDTGRRLDDRLQSVNDPVVLDELSDLIIDSATGEQLLSGVVGVVDGPDRG